VISGKRAFLVGFVAVALAGVLAVVALRSPGATIVDGFPLGTRLECATACSAVIDMATGALDARDPGHAPVVSAVPYHDLDPCSDGTSPVPCVRDSTLTVVVFRLADGSTRAAGVACIGVAPCVAAESYPFSRP
jgi:hypothetical protein